MLYIQMEYCARQTLREVSRIYLLCNSYETGNRQLPETARR